MAGNPLTILTFFSDTPRALAVTPDGSRVYAAAFHSGNRTTVIPESVVPDGGEAAGGVPGPNTNFQGIPAPEVGIIVRHDGEHWRDVLGRPWDDKVKFSLPDKDVFVIDAVANPPAQVAGGFYTGVGTILFNMAVNPVSGKVYVSNTEARNDLRFEGAGNFAGDALHGHLHESRISVLGAGGAVARRHLNKHIDYSSAGEPVPNAVSETSLAQPLGMAVTHDGSTLYVAAFGSSKIGVYSTAALESDTFVPSTANQIELSGGGPTGIVLDEGRGRMYVMTRFDNAISIVDTAKKSEVAHVAMFNPEPASVVAGRRFLYDARTSSSHGDQSCGSCHVFGDFDSLAWDLGNPDGTVVNNPSPIVPFIVPGFPPDPTLGVPKDFHPMKGPMVTQSLRGMANHGPMHWRGDRTGGNDEPSAQPDEGVFDEDAAFKKFNPAFVALLGRSEPLSAEDMAKFTTFILQVMYPPNPIRNLDNSLTAQQQSGHDLFFNLTEAPNGTCQNCHRLDPEANPSAGQFAGFFGTDGRSGFAAQPQIPKIPHLRNVYQKIGMFGAAGVNGSLPPDPFLGDQIRGIGFNHDGTIPTLFQFTSGFDFGPLNPVGIPLTPEGVQIKQDMEQFMLAFDSNLAPIVGQQVTLDAATQATVGSRIDLMKARADAGECDLVAKGRIANQEIGFLYLGGGQFAGDRQAMPAISDAFLRTVVVASGSSLTYTCAPPGSGERMGIDRDLDGVLDGDERAAGSDPADPTSTP
jgi:DNA-binding beta-propeller fold protein YncE